MTIQGDLDVTRGIRRSLVKHWIDLGRLSIRTSQGRVVIYGVLQRISGVNEELTTPIVEAMFTEMKRVPGLQRLTPHLDNWTLEGGRWRPIERTGPGIGATPETEDAPPRPGDDSLSGGREYSESK